MEIAPLSPFVGSFNFWTKKSFYSQRAQAQSRRKYFDFLNKILQNKQYQSEVLSKDFHFNAHTQEFHPQTRKLEPVVQYSRQHHRKVRLNSFLYLNVHTLGLPETQNLEPPCKS